MKMNKAVLAAAVAAAIGLGATGQASASVYGVAKLDIKDFKVLITNPDLAIGSFGFTTTNTAILNGLTSPTMNAACGGFPGIPGGGTNNCGAVVALDAAAANAPGSAPIRANNDFSVFGMSANQYSNSDSVIWDAELTGDALTRTQQIAEAELQNGKSASGNAEIQSSTGFTFKFTTGGLADLFLTFEADPYIRAAIMQGSNFINGNAQAQINAAFALTNDSNGQSTKWSPTGTAANTCLTDMAGVTCTELADGETLNRTVSVSTNPADVSVSSAVGWSAFGLKLAGLSAGDYTLSFNSVTSDSLRQTIPEPGALALVGAGLLGFGLTRRRRKA